MTMTAQEYRANARQCLSWAASANDPENRDAFFALAATWEGVATRVERSTAAPETGAIREPSLRRAAAGWRSPLGPSFATSSGSFAMAAMPASARPR
jgi:hypothetical protein